MDLRGTLFSLVGVCMSGGWGGGLEEVVLEGKSVFVSPADTEA